jgi:hypothetical protein
MEPSSVTAGSGAAIDGNNGMTGSASLQVTRHGWAAWNFRPQISSSNPN